MIERGTYNGLRTMCEEGGGGFAECTGRCATESCGKWWLYEGGSLVEIVGSEAVAIEWCTPECHTKSYTREDLIRVVLGQQWAVAIALHSSIYGAKRIAGHAQEWRVGGLPCAVDVVDGVG